MSFLLVENVAKRYGPEAVLGSVSLSLPEHETLAVLGRSGSGKTTLLRIIAGLEEADSGHITLGGRVLDHLPPQRRGAVYLSQEPLLFPHLDVFENVAFGLRLRGVPAGEVRRRVEGLLEDLGVSEHARKRPDQLSGGQQQRVAFGRAVIVQPALLLLDEPFGKLDVETRAAVQGLFQQRIHSYGLTSIFVTHDLKEALLVGDCIAHMKAGHLHVYPTRQAFVDDPATGVRDEQAFWTGIEDGSPEGPDA